MNDFNFSVEIVSSAWFIMYVSYLFVPMSMSIGYLPACLRIYVHAHFILCVIPVLIIYTFFHTKSVENYIP